MCKEFYFSIPRCAVRKVCNECNIYLQAKPLKIKEKFKHILAKKPFERLIIDLVDIRTYAEQNNFFSWILIGITVYSKYTITYAIKSKTAAKVLSNLNMTFYKLDDPQIIHCDNGKEFRNSCLIDFCKEKNIVLIHVRPRHSQGQIERFNQTLTRYLQKHLCNGVFATGKNWTALLDKVFYEYNIAIHSATNKSPFNPFLIEMGSIL